MLKNLLLIGAGGAAGSCLRYALSRWIVTLWPSFPQGGTIAVNLAGCLLIGLLLGCAERCQLLTPALLLLFVTGFCGGFTTFSTFAADAVNIADTGRLLQSLAYVAVSVIGGLALMFLARLVILKT